MKRTVLKRLMTGGTILLIGLLFGLSILSLFFDEAIFVRKGTLYHGIYTNKIVALTFDDGPSPEWTPQILRALKQQNVKATFFMLGNHVAQFPDIAKQVAAEGHEIGNHTYTHHGIFWYSEAELTSEIRQAEKTIESATGQKTKYFRPPKAWLTDAEKKQIERMGYTVVLWSLNSKDWVTYDDKYIIAYLMRNINPGAIILFHDSGGAFSSEGGDRHETVKTLPRLIRQFKKAGYRFVTISKLLQDQQEVLLKDTATPPPSRLKGMENEQK